MTGAAAEAHAFQPEVVAQDIDQRRRGLRFQVVGLAVDPQGDQAFPFRASLTRGMTCSAMSCIERFASFGSTQSWHG